MRKNVTDSHLFLHVINYQLKKRKGPPAGLVFGKCPGAGMGALMMLGGRGPPGLG